MPKHGPPQAFGRATAARGADQDSHRSRGLVGRILHAGWMQSFVGHAVVIAVLGVIVPTADEAKTPVRLVLAPPADAEEPLGQESIFIEVPLPVETQSELEPVPLEQPAVELLTVEDALPEPDAVAQTADPWALLAGDALLVELTIRPQDSLAPSQPKTRGPQAGILQGEAKAARPIEVIGGELGRRLQGAGAQTGDVQVSMCWDGVNDIDLHVMVEPFGGGRPSMIFWQQRFGACGGMLDVDANAHPVQLTPTPVENVFWARGRAPFGRYTIAVHHYMPWSRLPQTPVEVAVLVDGKVTRFQIISTAGEPARVVTSFIRHPAGAAGQLAAANPSNETE